MRLQQGFATGEMGFKDQAATQRSLAAHVRFGSKADIEAHPRNVRFTPKSGHRVSALACPLCAKSGLLQCKTLSPLWAKTEHELAAGWECAVRQLVPFRSRSCHHCVPMPQRAAVRAPAQHRVHAQFRKPVRHQTGRTETTVCRTRK